MNDLITFRISAVNFIYGDNGELFDIDLNFDTRDPRQEVFTNGRMTISTEEYFAANGLNELGDKVKTMYIARILGEGTEEDIEEIAKIDEE